jgi:hypothetical protein
MSTVTHWVEWFVAGSVDKSDLEHDHTVRVLQDGSIRGTIRIMVSLSGIELASPQALAEMERDQSQRGNEPYALAGVVQVGTTWVAQTLPIPPGLGVAILPQNYLPSWQGPTPTGDTPTILVRLKTNHARAHVSILVIQNQLSVSDIVRDGIREAVRPARPFGP